MSQQPLAPNHVPRHRPCVYAEIGIDKGVTTRKVARQLHVGSTIHLYDFSDVIERVAPAIQNMVPQVTVIPHSTTRHKRDSYVWALAMTLKTYGEGIFDYVYLDGAHTLDVDAAAFVFIDRLLKPGGMLEFDDYGWTLKASLAHSRLPPAKLAQRRREVAEDFPVVQRRTPHVKMIVDLIMNTHPNYREESPNRLYRKL